MIVVTIGDGRERVGAPRTEWRAWPPRGELLRAGAADTSAVGAAAAADRLCGAERRSVACLRAARRRDRRLVAGCAAPRVRNPFRAAGAAAVEGVGVAWAVEESGVAEEESDVAGEASGAVVAGAGAPEAAARDVEVPDVPASVSLAAVEPLVDLAEPVRFVAASDAAPVAVPVVAPAVARLVVVFAKCVAPGPSLCGSAR